MGNIPIKMIKHFATKSQSRYIYYSRLSQYSYATALASFFHRKITQSSQPFSSEVKYIHADLTNPFQETRCMTQIQKCDSIWPKHNLNRVLIYIKNDKQCLLNTLSETAGLNDRNYY